MNADSLYMALAALAVDLIGIVREWLIVLAPTVLAFVIAYAKVKGDKVLAAVPDEVKMAEYALPDPGSGERKHALVSQRILARPGSWTVRNSTLDKAIKKAADSLPPDPS